MLSKKCRMTAIAAMAFAALCCFALLFFIAGCSKAPPADTGGADYCTVTFDGEPALVEQGGRIMRPADPQKEGYTFIGWFCGGEKFDFNSIINQDTDLHSEWEKTNIYESSVWQAQDAAALALDSRAIVGLYRTTGALEVKFTVFADERTEKDEICFAVDTKVNGGEAPMPDDRLIRVARGGNAQIFEGNGEDWTCSTDSARSFFKETERGYIIGISLPYSDYGFEMQDPVGFFASCTAGGEIHSLRFLASEAELDVPSTYIKITSDNLFSEYSEVDLLYIDESIINNLAILAPAGNEKVLPFVPGSKMFTNRNYLLRPYTPQGLIGKSYLYSAIEGSAATASQSGWVIAAFPSIYTELKNELSAQGFEALHVNAPELGFSFGGAVIAERTDYYAKYLNEGDSVAVNRWALLIFDTIAENDYYIHNWIKTPASVVTDEEQLQEYSLSTRLWQGIPGIEATAGGRLFACWGSGNTSEPNLGNYVLFTYSDDGKEWRDLFVAVHPSVSDSRVMDAGLWIDPNGALWFTWSQCSEKEDGEMGVWAIRAELPDAEDAQLRQALADQTPVRICDGIKLNKPIVLSDGTWIFPALNAGEEDYVNIFASSDEGKTWAQRGRAFMPYCQGPDEPVLVEKNDGALWLLVRSTDGTGIRESYSYDGGVTWTKGKDSKLGGPSSRFALRRLQSGKLLLVNHYDFSGRNNLTAFLSGDDGKTWSTPLLLDERTNVSYPDVAQGKDGTIYIVWDYERTIAGTIQYAALRESDFQAGGALARERIRIISTIDADSSPVNTSGALLGSTLQFAATGGFDTAADTGAEDGCVHQRGYRNQFIYFKDFYGADFYAETAVTFEGALLGDAYPKLGMVVRNGENTVFFYLDAENVRQTAAVGLVQMNGKSWDWKNARTVRTEAFFTDEDRATLGILREGNDFTFFVNGYPVITASQLNGMGADDAAAAGLLTFNCSAFFRGSRIVTEEAELAEIRDAYVHTDIVFAGDTYMDAGKWTSYRRDMSDIRSVNIAVDSAKISDLNAENFLPYGADAIALHVGANDIFEGRSGNETAKQIISFAEKLRSAYPETTIALLSICPSPRYETRLPEIIAANEAIAAYCSENRSVLYIDVASSLLNGDGKPDVQYFSSDNSSLSAAGYVLWAQAIRSALACFPEGKPVYTITGTATDLFDTALEGVIVTAGSGISAVTDQFGRFEIKNIKPDHYTLTFTKEGYSPCSRSVTSAEMINREDCIFDAGEITLPLSPADFGSFGAGDVQWSISATRTADSFLFRFVTEDDIASQRQVVFIWMSTGSTEPDEGTAAKRNKGMFQFSFAAVNGKASSSEYRNAPKGSLGAWTTYGGFAEWATEDGVSTLTVEIPYSTFEGYTPGVEAVEPLDVVGLSFSFTCGSASNANYSYQGTAVGTGDVKKFLRFDAHNRLFFSETNEEQETAV